MAQCGLNVEPQNYNGKIISKVMGVSDPDACCDYCAKFKGCLRWVLDIGAKQCNLLSEDGVSLIGGSFSSGKVTPGYDAPIIVDPQWGPSFLVGLGLLTAIYLGGGMAYRRSKQGARGIDMVPHHRFWTALPGLVMNGVQFTHHFAVHRHLRFSPGDGAPVTAAGLSDAVPDYGTGDGDSYAGSSSSRKSKSSKKDKHEKEKREASPSGSKSSKSSKSSKGSSKEKKGSSKDKERKSSSKDKSRRASRSRNDVEDPEEQTPMLADSGGPSSGADSPGFDTRALAEQVDDGGGEVHSSMAKVKVVSLRE